MKKYYYNDMEFTQDQIDLVAEEEGLSTDDYLSSNLDIEIIEEINEDDDTEEIIAQATKFKPTDTGSSIDKLVNINKKSNVNINEESDVDIDQEIKAEDNQLSNDEIIEEETEPTTTQSAFKKRKIRNKVKKVIDQAVPIDMATTNISEDRIITKTEDDGSKTHYSIYDIINENNIDLNSLGDYDLKTLIGELGDDYSFNPDGVVEAVDGEDDIISTSASNLKEFEIVSKETPKSWKAKTLAGMSTSDFLDNVLTAEIFDDTENIAEVSLRELLPPGFKTEQTAWFRDRVKITAPDGTEKVFQVDLNPDKRKQNIRIESEIAELKTFIKDNRERVDILTGEVTKAGWKDKEYKEKRTKFANEFKQLIDTPINNEDPSKGGVKISPEQIKIVEDNNTTKDVYTGLRLQGINTLGIDSYRTEDMKKFFSQAYFQLNTQRKSEGLKPLTMSLQEYLNLERDIQRKSMEDIGFTPEDTSMNILGETSNNRNKLPYERRYEYNQRVERNRLIMSDYRFQAGDDGSFYEVTDEDGKKGFDLEGSATGYKIYEELIELTRQIAIQDGLQGQLEVNIEEYAENNWWSETSENLGKGIAGSAMLEAENKYLFKEAESQANIFKEDYINKKKIFEENEFSGQIKHWITPNAFESFNVENVRPEFDTIAEWSMEMAKLNIMPETDIDNNVLEDVYVKISGEKDEKGRDLIFIIEKGQNLYENINPNLTQKETGAQVLLMPKNVLNNYNNQATAVTLSELTLVKKTDLLLDAIEDLPSFADQVDAWDKNYNEIERFGVTLGISSLSLAKDLTFGAAMLTAYINPVYWGGQMLGLDMIEDLAATNTWLSQMLEVEKEGYNFSSTSFNQLGFEGGIWNGIKGFAEWSTDTLADTLPIMGVMILSGGSSSYALAISSGLAGLSAAGSKMTEMDLANAEIKEQIKVVESLDIPQDEKDLQVAQLNSKIKTAGSGKYLLNMGVSLVNEAAFARLTTAKWGAKMNTLLFKEGNIATRRLYGSVGERLKVNLKSWFSEANTEGLGELGVNTIDNLWNGRPLSQGGVEAYSGGFAVSFMMDGLGRGKGAFTKMNYTSNKEINSLTETQDQLVTEHRNIDDINNEIKKLKNSEGRPGKPLLLPQNIEKLNTLEKMKANAESNVADLMGEVETKINAIDSKLIEDGMRKDAASYYTKNQAEISKLRTKALNLAANPNSDIEGTVEFNELQEINEKYKKLENQNQHFLNSDFFGHEWYARKGAALSDAKLAEQNAVIEAQAIENIKTKLKKNDYVPDQSEIDAEATKILDQQIYDSNNAKAEVIADQGGWGYSNADNNAKGIENVNNVYNEYINSLSEAEANNIVEVNTEEGGTTTMTFADYLNFKKEKAIKKVKDGTLNGFFDANINTQFNFRENAVKNQKPGVPLHEGAHGATEKLIAADPESFNEASGLLVAYMQSEQTDVFNKMIIEGTNGLKTADGKSWDFGEVFSSFVEEVAAGNIDIKAANDFVSVFGMALNKGLESSSNGEMRIDFKGTNDINNFLLKLGEQVGLGEVDPATLAELEARQNDQGGKVIDINAQEENSETTSKIAASESKKSKKSNTKAELVEENKKLFKDKPKGFMDKMKANAAKIKSLVTGSASAPTTTIGQKEPASEVAKKAKSRINEAVDKVRSKIPAWKEGNRQKPNRVLDKLFSDISSDLDGMIKAKAERFVTNDKTVIDLTQNVDIKELQQAVKTELLADIRGFNKNNNSLYGYLNDRLKNRIGDVLPDLWTDMSQKDIDNLGTSDTKTVNENKTLVQSVPDVNLRNSLDLELGSPLSDLVLETVEKVLGTKMPEFRYVRKNKGGKRTNVDLASVKKVLSTNPTGEIKRQAERDLAGIYKQFTSDLESRFAEELRDGFVETFGSRTDYTDWLDINADAISDLSIEKLVAFERLVKGEKIFTEVVKENLSVEEVKQLEGTGLLVSATTNQGPTLYKKLNPSKQQVIDFFDIKGSKKGTRKDALADKISGELALNATMEIAGKPEVMEKFELGLENSGTGEVVTKAYLEDVSKAIGRGVDLKFSRSFDAKENVPIELKNTYKNGRKRFVDVLKKMGITDQNVDAAWQEVFGDTDFAKTKKGKDEAKGLIKEWKSLSKQISEVESILASEVQMEIINSVIDEVGGINDTERAEIIAKARREALLPTRKGRDFDDIVKQLAKNLGIKNGFAYEQLVYDATDRAVSKWSKENGKESALKIEGIRGEEGGKADFIATIGGNAFNVELKLNNARFGSVGVIPNTDAKGNINFDLTKDYSFNKDLLKMVYSANPDVKAWVDKANEIGKEKYGDSFLKYDFGDIIDKEVLAVLQGDGFQSRIQRKIVLPAESVGEGYIVGKNNGTAYMNISKLGDFKGERRGGLYKLRNPLDTSLEDPANLGEAVPYLDGEATWSLAIAKTTADSKNGPTKYKKAGIELVDGKLPGSRGWANANLRIQVTKLDGLPDSKIDMSTEPGLMDLQNLVAVQDLDVKKGEASGVNIENNSDSKVVPDLRMSETTNPESLRQAEILDRALEVARDPNAPIKKIRVFDFDDTLARTKSNVLYTMPDGTTGKLTAEEFAKKGDAMLAEGAVWDFSEFNKVMEGKKGPLFEVAQKIQETRGTDDVFVLTARAAEAAPAIKEFLDSVGLEIPIDNITGLGDSSPLAKSSWMVDKAAEGYNDFYFADDHLGNVDAVDMAMSVIDVKSKTQQAKLRFSESVGDVMNDIIYDKTGIESYKEYSSMRAKAKGRTKRSFSLIPSSAQDFGGLLYKLLAKGEKGDAQWQWMQDNLVKPFSRAMNDLSVSQNQLMNDFRELKKSIKGIPTNLKKKAFGGFTYEDITRIAAWDRQGISVDGLSKRDLQQIQDFVSDSPEINLFVNQLIELSKGDGYHYPGGDWLAGTITTDFMQGLRKDTRPRLLDQWNKNIDLAFDEKTFNKLEAAFGPKYVEALKDSIRRMRTGQNRKQGTSRLEARFQDYINNSVGAVMFLNARSAVLQTISAVNFVNWTDNNPLKAGKAFANQKQYWTDFMSLMNSDFLVDRRNGLKINVSESEIAEAAKTTGNSVKGVISYLLSSGFVLTQFADSFAIASGGATFYRNRVNTYIKQGLSKAEAEKKAFLDFRDTAEESQQSARADKISQQQASTLGRIVLSFANTPSQYARIMDKAGRDLVNGRGDAKSNISKIMYYGFVQNLMFTALQSAMFAAGFGEDEEEVSLDYFKNKGYSDKEAKQAMDYYNSKDSKKDLNTANSMLDNIMRGLGVQGVILATAKNVLIDLYRRSEKEGTYPGPQYDENAWKLLEVSPPISIKAKKYKGGMKDFEMNSWRPESKEPFNINNPSYRAMAKVIASVTNVPLDRLFQKMENIQGAMDETNESWQRVAMILGWPKWQLENNVQQADRFAKEKEGRKQYRAEQKKKTTRQYFPKSLPTKEEYAIQELKKQSDQLFKLTKSAQIDSLRQLGLTTDAIKRLKYEKDRVNKIIELNK